jgi:SAM-dependent methyltransferase
VSECVSSETIIDLYDRHAHDFDRERNRSLQERAWLDRFLGHVRPAGTVLDLGCGTGEPIARYVLDSGFSVVGVDSSPSMIEMCRERFRDSEWIVADMREVTLGRRLDGILAWNSFFHLNADDQRGMFPRFASAALPGAPLMFTSGTAEGEAIGSWCGEPLYHASLAETEYEMLLTSNGFSVEAFRAKDPDCGGLTVWLATRGRDARAND